MQIDPDCCDAAGQCSGDEFAYTQGGTCTNADGSQAFETCCRGVQAPGPAGAGPADVLMSTTDNPHKGAAIGLGVVGGAAALAGIGVGIAHLVGSNSEPHTAMTVAAAVGATELQVSDESKYKIGDYLEVGYPTQVRRITGFGSIILDAPLTVAVPAGGSVIKHAKEVAKSSGRAAPPPLSFNARVAGSPSAAAPYGQQPSNSSSDWSGSGSDVAPSSGSLNSSSTNNILAGFLVVCLLCAIVGVCAGVFFLMSKKKRKRGAEMDGGVQPQYGGYYSQPQGMSVPGGFGYTEAEGQPLMTPQYQPQYQMLPQMTSYQMQPQSFQPMTNMGYLA